MKKIYFVAALAAVLTGIAVYLFASYLDKKATVVVPQGTVVVAIAPIDENVKITVDMVQVITTAKEWIGTDAVTQLSDAVGKFNKYRVAAGAQIMRSGLTDAGEASKDPSGQLSYVVQKGMRAITISTDELSGVGYYINKGDYVDILHAGTAKAVGQAGENGQSGQEETIPYTELLLQHLKVLQVASRQQNATAQKDTPNYSYGSITLEIKPEDSLRLLSAMKNGSIYLMLRAAEDGAVVTIPAYAQTDINIAGGQ